MNDLIAPVHLPRVCYEIFVRAFCDSNGDGIGDINGITSKLDYLQELGIEAIWLTPIHPSPTYHKYDVTDYYAIEPEYGTMDDFRRLLSEAHQRGIHIYMDLVINHTSTHHPWFQKASASNANPYRRFYWWMTPQQIETRRIGRRQLTADSWEANPWHDNPGDPEKYYGMFTHSMPDLNYDSPLLRQKVYRITQFWLNEIGVDGFRLDAARHIYPYWEKERNPVFWEEFGKEIENIKPGSYTVGEVWAPAEEVGPYFRGLKANFHFDLSFNLQRILYQGTHQNLVRRLLDDYRIFSTYNPAFIDATMLTNHDQNRIGSVVEGNIAQMKLAAAMLLTLPGQPYIYYGEEIGMLGQKPDERIREPFIWTEDRNDPQRALWIKPRYSRRATVRALSLQQQDPNSLYNHYRKLIAVRKAEPALGQIQNPNLAETPIDTTTLLTYFRTHPTHPVLVIHNLIDAPQSVQLSGEMEKYTRLVFQTSPAVITEKNTIQLPAYGSVILTQGS
ncbi:alpha-amylase family glycosyl hydrolase [Telluribacter sp. SYSU D00476]|uniref:alpha-amylase family glycosyl hydrolase n=1 Tax=Telluribacter sp. SYSU D00476 TaxID=2811430 RepID=UPI001FF4030A|nr:alpha-amylase family glycosyl hydrolase [Telluribacter sp. SYSU D00476]